MHNSGAQTFPGFIWITGMVYSRAPKILVDLKMLYLSLDLSRYKKTLDFRIGIRCRKLPIPVSTLRWKRQLLLLANIAENCNFFLNKYTFPAIRKKICTRMISALHLGLKVNKAVFACVCLEKGGFFDFSQLPLFRINCKYCRFRQYLLFLAIFAVFGNKHRI